MIKVKHKEINGFRVHPIGIGTYGIGGGEIPDSSRDKADIAAIRYSIGKGQNHIDTAEAYASGHSEEVVGEAIKDLPREELFVATKIWRHSATADGVSRALVQSLKRLKQDYVDLVYIHSCWDEDMTGDYMAGLTKALDRGLTKAIGLSNFNLKQLKKAVSLSKHRISALQNHYSVGYQSEDDGGEELLAFCKNNKIIFVAYTPINGENKSEVRQLAEKYHKSPTQIVLNWLIVQENVITIPKSSDKKHIDENLGAIDFELSMEDLELLHD